MREVQNNIDLDGFIKLEENSNHTIFLMPTCTIYLLTYFQIEVFYVVITVLTMMLDNS